MSEKLMDKAWYIATTYSSHENKVAENINRRIESFHLEDKVFRVIVAEEKIVTVDKNGNEKEKFKNLYPGYIFVEMIMTDDTWYMVRNTPGVTGIAGSSGGGTKPTPVPPNEIESVLKRIGQIDETMLSKYKVGDVVRIIKGPYAGQEVTIKSIDPQAKIVMVDIFLLGRPTEYPVDFSIVEKV